VIGDIFQPTHLLFILVIVLIVLGPKRLPETARALGRGLRDFKNAVSGDDASTVHELHQQQDVTAPAPPTPPQTVVASAPQDPVEGAG
jgi:sec-independent protein translocase protein TatA